MQAGVHGICALPLVGNWSCVVALIEVTTMSVNTLQQIDIDST